MARKALLVFQGGGALGAYQCGAYKVVAPMLQRVGIDVAGIAGASIGALNAALIACHLHETDRGAGALEAFWREDLIAQPLPVFPRKTWYQHCWNGLLTMLLRGNPGLSRPNYLAWGPWGTAWRSRMALHDTRPMERLLEKRIGTFGANPGSHPLLLVRAVNAATQRQAIFHSWREALTPRHLVASCSVPLLYPLADIAGKSYWDGDILPRSPLRDLLLALRSAPGGNQEKMFPEALPEYLVIIFDVVRGEGREPKSALDLLFQVQAAMLAPRVDMDEERAEADRRYLDFLEDCTAAAEGVPMSALTKRIAREKEAALAGGICRLDILRIQRERTLPFEYISRDMDFSPKRLGLLIEQGARDARMALEERFPQAGPAPLN